MDTNVFKYFMQASPQIREFRILWKDPETCSDIARALLEAKLSSEV